MRLRAKGSYPIAWKAIAARVKAEAGNRCVRCGHPHDRESGHVLTVHHWDGDKSNCRWWNLMALCQRCHLSIQARVDPNQAYCLEHSAWCKPYAAGFYAWKYLGLELDRVSVVDRMEELLNIERT